MAERPAQTHQSTVATLLRMLHEKGYVSRERSPFKVFSASKRAPPLIGAALAV